MCSCSSFSLAIIFQYMVTCVPPQSDDDDKTECANVCHFALDMLDALRRYNSKNTEHNLNLRIGVNIGEVVAGVVGTKRFLYDVSSSMNLPKRALTLLTCIYLTLISA